LLTEVPEAVRFLLVDDFSTDAAALDKVKAGGNGEAVLRALQEALAQAGEWTAESAKAAIAAAATSLGVKAGQMMFPLRVALSGKAGGPDLGVILTLLGRERSLQRIEQLRQRLS
jgi:glutamyl-tRNA synthetase